jgi:hypothetical protein
VLVHGARAELEDLGDVAVRLAARDPQQHLGLALGDGELLPQRRLLVAGLAFDQPQQVLVVADLADVEQPQRRLARQIDRAARAGGREVAFGQSTSRAEAPRAFLTAPYFAAMPAGRRAAFAANERSAHAPQQLSKMDRYHRPGCGCCAPKKSRTVRRGRDGAKSFPESRPWMISH